MKSVEVLLPDQLADEAQRAGLLSPAGLEALLRKELRSKSFAPFFAAMDRAIAIPDPAPMSPEDVAAELAAMRAERRERNPH